MTGLYFDPEPGKFITTNSMVKAFRTCPKMTDYKYAQRLKVKRQGGALKRGVWMHELLEIKHRGGDWRAHHRKLSSLFNEMFDEEREYYGDLPGIILHMMESYEWHYGQDDLVVHETEVTLEAELPDGRLGRGKVDAIVELHDGLYIADHKTHGRLPDMTFRLTDAQKAFYIWLAWKSKIPVKGFLWNYIKWKMPSTPKLVCLSTTPRLSKTLGETDYPTYTAALKKYRAENPKFKITREYVEHQRMLKAVRYDPQNPVLTSPFFERRVLMGDRDMVMQIMREFMVTQTRMHGYEFGTDRVERTPGNQCSWCDYRDLCQAELMGGDGSLIRRNLYRVGDPQDYYQDRVDEPAGMSA
jgi:hypothetical protein